MESSDVVRQQDAPDAERQQSGAEGERRPFEFSDATRERARAIIARYPAGRERSALLPLLHLVQNEQGRVTPAGVAFCAEQLGLTKAEVGAVATFYTMYKRRPTGDYLVSVCTNTLCDMMGGAEIFRRLSTELGVGHDETTEDGTITLEHAECLAACDYAPIVTVNYEFFDNQSADSASDIVASLRRGERPTPSRGAPICTLKEMALQLAGLTDDRDDAVGSGVSGPQSLRGTRLAEENNVSAPSYDVNAPIP